MIELTLVIPSLLGPLPNLDFENNLGFEIARLPALELLLARAGKDTVSGDSLEQVLAALFDLDTGQVPVAAISAIADGLCRVGDTGECWLRVDPVHLQADMARLVLQDVAGLEIRQQEADAMVHSLNELYRDEGWRFYAPHPQRWYLSMARAYCPKLTTTPLASALGQDVDGLLPVGRDGLQWHRMMNEIQMLLHGHAVNQARMVQGRSVINSVWCWGEGALPDAVNAGWDGVWSDEPFATGLARLAGSRHYQQPADAGQCLRQCAGVRQLVVLDVLRQQWLKGDLEGWLHALQELERQWFAPLKEALANGGIAALTLLPCTGAGYRITRGGLRRFWRRTQPWSRYLAG